MAGPPSVTKYRKGELIFEDRSKLVGWTISQLQRRALQDVGNMILTATRNAIQFYLMSDIGNPRPRIKPVKKKKRKNGFVNSSYNWTRYQSWVRKRENDLILGIENQKLGAKSAWWADQSELGTNRQPKRAALQNTVKAKAPQVVKIVEYYLGMLNDDNLAIREASAAPDKDVIQ